MRESDSDRKDQHQDEQTLAPRNKRKACEEEDAPSPWRGNGLFTKWFLLL